MGRPHHRAPAPSNPSLPCGSRPACWPRKPEHPPGSCLPNRPDHRSKPLRLYISTDAHHNIADHNLHHLARHSFKACEPDRSASPRKRRDHSRGQRLASPRKQLRRIEPVTPRDRRHVRPRRKRLPDDAILLLTRPGAIAPPGTDRKTLSRSRDNFEVLGLRHMFAHMNSWDKSPGDHPTIEHRPLRGVTYTLTMIPSVPKKESGCPVANKPKGIPIRISGMLRNVRSVRRNELNCRMMASTMTPSAMGNPAASFWLVDRKSVV